MLNHNFSWETWVKWLSEICINLPTGFRDMHGWAVSVAVHLGWFIICQRTWQHYGLGHLQVQSTSCRSPSAIRRINSTFFCFAAFQTCHMFKPTVTVHMQSLHVYINVHTYRGRQAQLTTLQPVKLLYSGHLYNHRRTYQLRMRAEDLTATGCIQKTSCPTKYALLLVLPTDKHILTYM